MLVLLGGLYLTYVMPNLVDGGCAILISVQWRNRLKILIVDDDEQIRVFLSAVLRQANFETLEAEDGTRALRVCAAQSVDLVLTDLCMPGKEGFETMQALRQAGNAAKIVVMSGAFEAKLLPLAKKLGADAVLAKPIDVNQLLTTIETVLGLPPRQP
jgi:DNA-binding response OmpR family regulator